MPRMAPLRMPAQRAPRNGFLVAMTSASIMGTPVCVIVFTWSGWLVITSAKAPVRLPEMNPRAALPESFAEVMTNHPDQVKGGV